MSYIRKRKFAIIAAILLFNCSNSNSPSISYHRVDGNLNADIRSLYEHNNQNLKNAISLLIMSKNGDLPYNLVEKISESIINYSYQYNFDPLFITSVMYRESEYNPFALSPAGAAGLMQVMPRFFSKKGVNIFDIDSNISSGVAELARLRDKYQNYSDMLMAYLGGEGLLRDLRRGEISEETAILMNYYTYIILINYQILSSRYRVYLNDESSFLSMY
jgi:soluble lytic murein transglycosylase-like protein